MENKLTLGTAQFGLNYGIANFKGQISFEESTKIIQLARLKGIESIDTAIAYGDSEKVLGKIGVNNFKIISKLPDIPSEITNIKSWVIQSIKKSLEHLKISKIYGLLLHRSDLLTHNIASELYSVIQELKKLNYISKFGVSIYSPNELERIPSEYTLEIVQAPMNIIDQSLIRTGWLYKLKDLNIEVHVRSLFLQGLLLMTKEKRPKKFGRWDNLWNVWHTWLEENNYTPLQACLGFIRSIKEVDQIVVGVDNCTHLSQILEAYMSDLYYNIPEEMVSIDEDLIHPFRWSNL